jgi:MoaA/NifB/PqqE/SkfB family radical SAM enzyme
MFNFSELKRIHVELTSLCQASCPMCARNYHGGLPNKNLPIDEISYEQFQQIFTEEVLNQIEHIYFCGNYGDPIMSNHLIDIVKYCVRTNARLSLGIHTNGSARSTEWWKELASSLPRNHCVHFALDGLEDTHHLYRIGTNYGKIIENAKAFISAGGIAEWVFISFKHNENQVEQARITASQLGFAKFVHKQTIRFVEKPWFDVVDRKGKVQYKLEPPTESAINFIKPEVVKGYKKYLQMAEIKCKVKQEKSLYVDAFKNLWPCCWIGAIPYSYSDSNSISYSYQLDNIESIKNLVEELGGYDSTNLLKNSIKDIINSDIWSNIWDEYWNEKKLPTCAKICGNFPDKIISQPNEQFLKVQELK